MYKCTNNDDDDDDDDDDNNDDDDDDSSSGNKIIFASMDSMLYLCVCVYFSDFIFPLPNPFRNQMYLRTQKMIIESILFINWMLICRTTITL